jgi:hypothetical protein
MATAGKNDELSMPDLANTFHHSPKLYLKNPKNSGFKRLRREYFFQLFKN